MVAAFKSKRIGLRRAFIPVVGVNFAIPTFGLNGSYPWDLKNECSSLSLSRINP